MCTVYRYHNANLKSPHASRHAAACRAAYKLLASLQQRLHYDYDYEVSIPPTKERMDRIDEELIEAAQENNLPEASRLLSVGADVNAEGERDRTPLHWASLKGHVQVVVVLLEHGADIEAKNDLDWTPLHYACFYGHVTVGNELLSRGANIEAKTMTGDTPLHWASHRDHLPVVKALRAVGANILAANNSGELAIHRAVRFEHSAVAKHLLREFYATIRRLPLHELLKDLTWIGSPNIRVAPPLRFALHRNMLGADDVVEILEFLVSQDPDSLASHDQDGSLPLHLACRRGASFTVVQSLVNLYKASVKSVTSQGDLPLFLACEIPEPSLDTIFLLMKLYPDLVYR
jgi:ankyrin repeat protein